MLHGTHYFTGEMLMNTQYEKNSVHMAAARYRMAERKRRLTMELCAFFAAFGIVCMLLYIAISAM